MIDDKGTTQGDVILERLGFTLNGEPYGYEWVWWSVLFCIGLCIMSIIASVFFLNHVRYATGKAAVGGTATEEEEDFTHGIIKQEARAIIKTIASEEDISISSQRIELSLNRRKITQMRVAL